jgi:hypothetical protein
MHPVSAVNLEYNVHPDIGIMLYLLCISRVCVHTGDLMDHTVGKLEDSHLDRKRLRTDPTDPFLNEGSAIVINQDTSDKNPQPTTPLKGTKRRVYCSERRDFA